MLGKWAFGVIALAVSSLFPAVTQACSDLLSGPRGTVAEVTDGDTLVLDSGLVVRLIGTQAPKLPLGRPGFPTWPLAGESRAELERLTLGKQVEVRYGGERQDRYRRALGHVFVLGDPEVWAQREMVGRGLARVYSFPDNRHCLSDLFAAEENARARALGIWGNPYYSVRRADRPDDILEHEGGYELVEGQILGAERAGTQIYLNFGQNWKKDFTAVIDRDAEKLFVESGLDPLALGGKRVRIRGWIDRRDGPRVEISHPEQIEVLSSP